MRFRGQRHAMRTLLGGQITVAGVRAEFESQYRRRYGFAEPNAPLEIVSLVLTGMARIDRPALSNLRPATAVATEGLQASRPVYFAEAACRIKTPVLQRQALATGHRAAGPAIIEEYGSTTVVGPNDSFEIGDLGEIRIKFN